MNGAMVGAKINQVSSEPTVQVIEEKLLDRELITHDHSRKDELGSPPTKEEIQKKKKQVVGTYKKFV